MRIYIKAGDKLLIGFMDERGEPMDGEFSVSLSEDMGEIKVEETGGFDGNILGKANSILYHEKNEPHSTEKFAAVENVDLGFKVFEVAGRNFNGSGHTDDHILWVAADQEVDLVEALVDTPYRFYQQIYHVDDKGDIDFFLTEPKGQQALRRKLNQLAKKK